MKKLIITCHPTPRSTVEGMKRILSAVRDLATKCGVAITWNEEPAYPAYPVTSKLGEAIKVWADELRPRGFDVPLGAQKNLEAIITDLLSNNCPEGGCYANIFKEEMKK